MSNYFKTFIDSEYTHESFQVQLDGYVRTRRLIFAIVYFGCADSSSRFVGKSWSLFRDRRLFNRQLMTENACGILKEDCWLNR